MISVEQIYQFIVTAVPDWAMALLMALAAWTLFRRYQIRGGATIWVVISALLFFSAFYTWGYFFQPPPLSRLAAGRVVSLTLALSIIAWGRLAKKNE
jgi:hypothetical protein